MSFAQHRARLTEGVFATLGVDARWTGVDVPVRVRLAEEDKVDDYGRVDLIQRVRVLRVRKIEVAAPKRGDEAHLLGEDGEATGDVFRVAGEGSLNRNGVWVVPVARVQP